MFSWLISSKKDNSKNTEHTIPTPPTPNLEVALKIREKRYDPVYQYHPEDLNEDIVYEVNKRWKRQLKKKSRMVKLKKEIEREFSIREEIRIEREYRMIFLKDELHKEYMKRLEFRKNRTKHMIFMHFLDEEISNEFANRVNYREDRYDHGLYMLQVRQEMPHVWINFHRAQEGKYLHKLYMLVLSREILEKVQQFEKLRKDRKIHSWYMRYISKRIITAHNNWCLFLADKAQHQYYMSILKNEIANYRNKKRDYSSDEEFFQIKRGKFSSSFHSSEWSLEPSNINSYYLDEARYNEPILNDIEMGFGSQNLQELQEVIVEKDELTEADMKKISDEIAAWGDEDATWGHEDATWGYEDATRGNEQNQNNEQEQDDEYDDMPPLVPDDLFSSNMPIYVEFDFDNFSKDFSENKTDFSEINFFQNIQTSSETLETSPKTLETSPNLENSENQTSSKNDSKYKENVEENKMKRTVQREHPEGYLEIFMGPMFSGKSSRVLFKLSSMADQRFRCLYVNSIKDVRNTESQDNFVTTHNSSYSKMSPKITCIKVSNLSEVNVTDYDYIAIDELQFFDDDNTVRCISDWISLYGKCVLVASLDGDCYRRKFGRVLDLIPHANEVTKLNAYCDMCRDNYGLMKPAPFTARMTSDTTAELVGGTDLYKAMCRECHDFHLDVTVNQY